MPMRLRIAIPQMIKWGVLLPIAYTCLERCFTLLPIKGLGPDSPPAPLVFHSAPWLYAVLWGLVGFMLLATVLFQTNKIPIMKGRVLALRFDDLSIVLTSVLYLVWGISYYLSWILGDITHHVNTDYISARNYFPIGLALLFAWSFWFQQRAKQVLESLTQQAEVLTAQKEIQTETYDKIGK